ncbi:hypothetical protein PAMA_008966 [Pampus argenteus]
MKKPFPELDKNILKERASPNEGKDKQPTIVYMPLFNKPTSTNTDVRYVTSSEEQKANIKSNKETAGGDFQGCSGSVVGQKTVSFHINTSVSIKVVLQKRSNAWTRLSFIDRRVNGVTNPPTAMNVNRKPSLIYEQDGAERQHTEDISYKKDNITTL